MSARDIAYQQVKKSQGFYPYFSDEDKLKGEFLLCSECFSDEGLHLDAGNIGIVNMSACKNCQSLAGKKLTKQIIRELCYRFFVRGTIEQFEYGGFPLIQMNEEHFQESDISVSAWLEKDVKVIEATGEIGLFYYGPRFWMVGEIEPLKALQKSEEIDSVVDRILNVYPKNILTEDHSFYRVRRNPKKPYDFAEYDSAPDGLGGASRFDGNGGPVLYASPDLELCIHECRATVEDDLYVAKLVPTRPLMFLNLAEVIFEEERDHFTSLDLSIHFLFLAKSHSYPICSHIARRIRKAGFDGIIYPSYFSNPRTGAIPFETIFGMSIRYIEDMKEYAQSRIVPNVLLFGRPIEDDKVRVHSVNKVLINSVKYELSFGPALQESMKEKDAQEKFVENRRAELTRDVMDQWNQD
jgi:hypothetical protein